MGVYSVSDRVLSDAELWDLTNRYFGDLGPGVVQGMFNIAKRESGGQAGIVNFNPGTRDDSHGLWQINIRPDANPKYIGWRLDDPELNAKAARELYDAAGGPTPWSTYNAEADAAMFGGSPAEYGHSAQAAPMLTGSMAASGPTPYQPAAAPMLGWNAAALAQGAARQMYMGGVQGPHAEAQTLMAAPTTPEPMLPSNDILLPLLKDSTSIWGGRLPSPLDAMFPMLGAPQ